MAVQLCCSSNCPTCFVSTASSSLILFYKPRSNLIRNFFLTKWCKRGEKCGLLHASIPKLIKNVSPYNLIRKCLHLPPLILFNTFSIQPDFFAILFFIHLLMTFDGELYSNLHLGLQMNCKMLNKCNKSIVREGVSLGLIVLNCRWIEVKSRKLFSENTNSMFIHGDWSIWPF